jgi:hypothetical protein
MRWNRFGPSLLFAAAAAAGWLVVAALVAPALGLARSLELFAVASGAVYLVGIAPTRRGALAAGGVGSALGAIALWLPLGPATTAIAAATIVAVCRSALLYRARPLRGIALEVVLGVAGLALAGFLAGGGATSLGLAVWGYFLVQSGFFLAGGVSRRAFGEPEVDPFDQARARLTALLE